jgi:hypothetical protein
MNLHLYLSGDGKPGVYIGDATLGHFDKFSAKQARSSRMPAGN